MAEKTASQTDKNYDLEIWEKIEISLDKRKESSRDVFYRVHKGHCPRFEGFVDANDAVGDPPRPNLDGILVPMYSAAAFEKIDFASGEEFTLNTAPVLFERVEHTNETLEGGEEKPTAAKIPSYRWISVKITKALSSEK